MNKRTVITVLAIMLFLGTGWGVLVQRQELARLRAEHERRTAQLVAPDEDLTAPTATGAEEESQGNSPGDKAVVSELLRLRGEVSRLAARTRELAGVRAESDQLRARLEASSTNALSGVRLPPGYIRKATAQWAGCGTPEATLQSLLWAVQNQDFTNLLKVFSPESAESLQAQVRQPGNSIENFFKSADGLPGLAVMERHDVEDGIVELQIQFAPGTPSQKIRLQQTNGEWKLTRPF